MFLYKKDYVFHKNVFKWNERKPFYFILPIPFFAISTNSISISITLAWRCIVAIYATDNRNILTIAFCFVLFSYCCCFASFWALLFIFFFFLFLLFSSFYSRSFYFWLSKASHLKHLQLFYGKFISVLHAYFNLYIYVWVCNQLVEANFDFCYGCDLINHNGLTFSANQKNAHIIFYQFWATFNLAFS